jgi:hypothetical protein
VIDSVEKFFEIQVDHNVVAFGDIPLRLGYRLMGRTSRTETVAMTARPTTPSADSCATVGSPLDFPSSNNTGTTEQWNNGAGLPR